MVQASTSAAFTADMVRAGTVVAAETIATAAVLIATAAAIHLMGEGRKSRGAGAAEPPPVFTSRPPSKRAVFFGGTWTQPPAQGESYADGRRLCAQGFCQGDRGPVMTSVIPIGTRWRNAGPYDLSRSRSR